MSVVVGIFPNHDAVAKLVDSLKAGGFDLERLTVISEEEASEELATSGVQFVLSGEPDEANLSAGTGIITGFGGTGVPGITGQSPTIEPFHTESTVDLLGDLDIPDGRTDDYAGAIDAGRAVAGYTGGDADKLKPLFSDAGGSPVEVF